MRLDWDARAAAGAADAIYTHDSKEDIADFDASGLASYRQLLHPFLPVLLEGRAAKVSKALEIGCGIGRMTRWAAREFGEVHALDVSPAMVEQGRARLADCPNVTFHLGSGYDLRPLPDAFFDLVFSYIVFQHIPERAAIENYVREAARVLKPRGVFKFQVNGDQSPEYRAHVRDTWLGETFSSGEALEMLSRAGLSLVAAEGMGTQYFVLTARRGAEPVFTGPRPWVFPGEPWAAGQLPEGWGEPVDHSWRPLVTPARAVLGVPPAGPARFFIGLYIWPGEANGEHCLKIALNGAPAGSATLGGAGDHYVEFPVAPLSAEAAEVRLSIHPVPTRPPAVRCLGLGAISAPPAPATDRTTA